MAGHAVAFLDGLGESKATSSASRQEFLLAEREFAERGPHHLSGLRAWLALPVSPPFVLCLRRQRRRRMGALAPSSCPAGLLFQFVERCISGFPDIQRERKTYLRGQVGSPQQQTPNPKEGHHMASQIA